MTNSATMTIQVRADLTEKLERIASETQRSKSVLVDEAIAAYVDHELAAIDAIKRGIADVDAGRIISHAEVVADMHALVAGALRRKATHE